MFYSTTDSARAEIAYRQERIARDFRRANLGSRGRRTDTMAGGDPHRRWSLHLRHAA